MKYNQKKTCILKKKKKKAERERERAARNMFKKI